MSTADGWVAGTKWARNSMQGGPQRIPRGCKRKDSEGGDEVVGKVVIVTRDGIGNDIGLARNMEDMNVQSGACMGINGGDKNIVVGGFGV